MNPGSRSPSPPPPYDSNTNESVSPTTDAPKAVAQTNQVPTLPMSVPEPVATPTAVAHSAITVSVGNSATEAPPQQPAPMPPMPRQQTFRRSQSRAVQKQPIQVNLAKPLDDKHTVIAMVVDRSGSMKTMGDEVHGGCNAYLDEQRKTDAEDGGRTDVIFTRFDNRAETIYDGVTLSQVPAITKEDVKPRGGTALYDAIGATLVKTAAMVNALEKRPGVVVFILTDGQENASQGWDKKTISAEIKKLQGEGYNWDFYFAAANQDAMVEGSALGMDREQCMTYAPEAGAGKMAQAMLFSQKAAYRKKKGFVKGYTESERNLCK